MLILFPDTKTHFQHFTIACFLIVLGQSLSFLFFQTEDQNYRSEAERFYFKSQLDHIEIPLYRQFTKQTMDPNLSKEAYYQLLKNNFGFQSALQSDSLLNDKNPLYWQWVKNKRDYNYLLQKDRIENFGFKTASPTWLSAFCSLFLQSTWRSFGINIFFLLLIGPLVEALIGSVFFLLIFFGLHGATLALPLYFPDVAMVAPIVGSHGSLSGLLGILLIAYGFKTVTLFCLLNLQSYLLPKTTLGVITLIWFSLIFVIQEISILIMISGFIMGLFIGTLIRVKDAIKNRKNNQKYQVVLSEYEKKIVKAEHYMSDFKFQEAKKILFALQQEYPSTLAVIMKLFNTVKFEPSSEDYHQVVAIVFSLKAPSREAISVMNIVFKHYLKMAEPSVRYDPNIFLRLAREFRKEGYLEDCEKILKILIKSTTKPMHETLAREQFLLATSYLSKKDTAKAQRLFEWLLYSFPKTESAQQARLIGRDERI